jgi:hypothetical protein
VASDHAGNVIVAGTLRDGFSNKYSMFLAKYSQLGDVIWTKNFDATNSTHGTAVTCDQNNNIYVTAWDHVTTPIPVPVEPVYSRMTSSLVLKFNSSGDLQWSRSFGDAAATVNLYGICLDNANNVYVTGSTNATSFNGQANLGSTDAFLIKLSSAGVVQWTVLLGTSGSEVGYSLARDPSSNDIVLSGYSTGTFDLSNANGGVIDVMVAKFNTAGTRLWVKLLGGLASDYGRSVTVGKTGEIFVAGFIANSAGATFDGNTVFGGTYDSILAKFSSAGVKQWSYTYGTVLSDGFSGIAIDSLNNIYMAGYTNGILLAGLTNSGNKNDIVVMKVNPGGTVLWTRQTSLPAIETGMSIVVDRYNGVFVSGTTSGGMDSQSKTGSVDVFVAKYV